MKNVNKVQKTERELLVIIAQQSKKTSANTNTIKWLLIIGAALTVIGVMISL